MCTPQKLSLPRRWRRSRLALSWFYAVGSSLSWDFLIALAVVVFTICHKLWSNRPPSSCKYSLFGAWLAKLTRTQWFEIKRHAIPLSFWWNVIVLAFRQGKISSFTNVYTTEAEFAKTIEKESSCLVVVLCCRELTVVGLSNCFGSSRVHNLP